MISKDLPGDRQSSDIGSALAIRHAEFEETAASELFDEITAACIEIIGWTGQQAAPLFKLRGEFEMPRFEEGPGEEAAVNQSQHLASLHLDLRASEPCRPRNAPAD